MAANKGFVSHGGAFEGVIRGFVSRSGAFEVHVGVIRVHVHV